ncbi:MAG: smr protein/Muts2-like [Rickettsiales bacterium]|jgi:DNA-nicking Smr family endonuclease|nr:smr protein/Muts2-like [Rickettsiales bacterium]
MAKKPPISPEDKSLWEEVAKTITPFRKRDKQAPKPTPPAPQNKAESSAPRFDFSRAIANLFGRGNTSAPTATPMRELTPDHITGVDTPTLTKLTKGTYPIDRRIDLHGLSQDEAYATLSTAIESAYAQGKRCLLVITGKGKEGSGILRARLPEWLNGPQLRRIVLAFVPAHRKHGGDGAFYVLVKRDRGR